MSAHTPTPWRSVESGIDRHSIWGFSAGQRNRKEDALIATVNRFDAPHEAESNANAALIVESVNSHASLLAEVERLKGLLAVSDGDRGRAAGERDRLTDAVAGYRAELDRVRAALVLERSGHSRTVGEVERLREALRLCLHDLEQMASNPGAHESVRAARAALEVKP